MKILTSEEGKNWLQNHQFPIGGRELRRFFKHSIVYVMRDSVGAKIVLAESLIDFIGSCDEENSFWIKDWDISYENMNLFDGFRKGLKENRSISEASFHVYNNNDLKDIESLLLMSLFFTWDAYLVSPDKKTIISPNDEYIYVTCDDKANATKYKEYFESMNFKKSEGR